MVSRGLVGDLFRHELKAERTRRGLTQQQLADALTASLGETIYGSTIAKIERGARDVRLDELAAIAELFGVSTDTLLGRPSSGTDTMWAASRLTGNAHKMVVDIGALAVRARDDTGELEQIAVHEKRVAAMADLIAAGHVLNGRLVQAADAAHDLGKLFPLPGL